MCCSPSSSRCCVLPEQRTSTRHCRDEILSQGGAVRLSHVASSKTKNPPRGRVLLKLNEADQREWCENPLLIDPLGFCKRPRLAWRLTTWLIAVGPRSCATRSDDQPLSTVINARASFSSHRAWIAQRRARAGATAPSAISGIAVLRCLLLTFHDRATGLCCPSYDAIQKVTGLCRQSVAEALRRLAAVRIVGVVRRLDRVATGGIVRAAATNLYWFTVPAQHVAMPRTPAPQGCPTRMPRRGSAGEIIAAICESTLRSGTNKGGYPMKEYAPAAHDWRARARLGMTKKGVR